MLANAEFALSFFDKYLLIINTEEDTMENPNDVKEFKDLAKLYELLDKVTLSYDALFRMEADGAPGMDIAIMNGDYFRPAVEELVNYWEEFK